MQAEAEVSKSQGNIVYQSPNEPTTDNRKYAIRGLWRRNGKYVDDCVKGIDLILRCDDLIATLGNLSSSEVVSIHTPAGKVETITGVNMKCTYDLNATKGVADRNSDNMFINKDLGWEPGTPLDKGLAATYRWIKGQYEARKAGKRVGIG